MPAELTPAQETARSALVDLAKDWKRDRDAARKSRIAVDKQIRRAVKAGVSYRMIAVDVGMSLAWVQGSIDRTAPKETT